MAERRKCAAVSAQTGKPCRLPAAEGALVCSAHAGMSKKQKDALKAGQKKRAKLLKDPTKQETAGQRWARLLDGSLKVKDLDDDEISKMRVRGKGGQFAGRRPALPSHIAEQFQKEGIRRARAMFPTAAPRAVQRLLDIAEDPDTKDSDAIRALEIILNRGLGKTPEVIEVRAESKFDQVSGEAVGLDRTVADEAEAFLAGHASEEDG